MSSDTTLKFDFQLKAKMQNQEYLLLLALLSFKNSVCYLKIKIILAKKRFTEFLLRWNLITNFISTLSYFPFLLLNLPLYKILFHSYKFNLYNHSVYYIHIRSGKSKLHTHIRLVISKRISLLVETKLRFLNILLDETKYRKNILRNKITIVSTKPFTHPRKT